MRPTGRWIRSVAGVGLVLGLIMTGTPRAAFAVFDGNTFQLKGNPAYASNPSLGDNWDQLNQSILTNSSFYTKPSSFPAPNAGFTGAKDFSPDAPPESPASYFTGGHSKDPIDINSCSGTTCSSNWLSGATSAQPKDEITNAFSAAYNAQVQGATHQLLYYGADRFSNGGNSTMGFWFFKSNVSWNSTTNTFSGVHTPGDVLIVADFPGNVNGSVSAVNGITAYKWDPSCTGATKPTGAAGSCADNNLRILASSAAASSSDCQSQSPTSVDFLCATVNRSLVGAPWPYTPASAVGVPQQYQPGTFEEGGIDITHFFGTGVCFQSFESETRASNSTSATLSDFTMGNFNTCDAKVTISPHEAINQVGSPHTMTVATSGSSGAGFSPAPNSPISVSVASGTGKITGGTCFTPNPLTTPSVGPVAGVTGATGTCTVTIVQATAGVSTVHVNATITIGGQTLNRSTSSTANDINGDAIKHYVDGNITITPATATNSIGQAHTMTVTVLQSLDSGTTTPVSGASVTTSIASDTTGGASITGGTCGPTGSTDTNGQCTVTINSSSPGTVTVHAKATWSVVLPAHDDNGVATTITQTLVRETDGKSVTPTSLVNSGDATKIYKAGSITLTKTVDVGPFTAAPQVCFTLSYKTGSTGPTVSPITTDTAHQCQTPAANTSAVVVSRTLTYAWHGLASHVYTLTEDAMPSPYTTLAAFDVTVDATNSDPTQVDVSVSKSNPLPPGGLTINKTVNGGPIPANASFGFDVSYCSGGLVSNACANPQAVTGSPFTITAANNPLNVSNSLAEGYYLVHESSFPTGYVPGADQIAQVFAGKTGPNATVVNVDNTLLFRIITVVCDEGGHLKQASVAMTDSRSPASNTSPQNTTTTNPFSGSGVTDQQLCNLSPSSYRLLPPSTSGSGSPYSQQVTITP